MVNQTIVVGIINKILEDSKQDNYIYLKVYRDFKNNDGIFEFDIIRCKIWRGMFLSLKTHLKKGLYVSVVGMIKSNGEDYFVEATKVDFLGRIEMED